MLWSDAEVRAAHLRLWHNASNHPAKQSVRSSRIRERLTYGFMDATTACRTKGLDSEIFPFLHLRLVIGLHDRDGLVAVYPIPVDRVAVEVLYALNYWLLEDAVVRHEYLTNFGRYQFRQQPHRIPLSPGSPLRFHPFAHQYRIPERYQPG